MFAKCLNCGARFRFIPSQTAGKYCSRECDYAARKVTSEVAEGIAWRQAMVRMGKHHSEQLDHPTLLVASQAQDVRLPFLSFSKKYRH